MQYLTKVLKHYAFYAHICRRTIKYAIQQDRLDRPYICLCNAADVLYIGNGTCPIL